MYDVALLFTILLSCDSRSSEPHSLSPMPRFFFFTHPATPQIYTLSLHDALPISCEQLPPATAWPGPGDGKDAPPPGPDRKSTRLNSSHVAISYAVFCLKKKKKTTHPTLILRSKQRSGECAAHARAERMRARSGKH